MDSILECLPYLEKDVLYSRGNTELKYLIQNQRVSAIIVKERKEIYHPSEDKMATRHFMCPHADPGYRAKVALNHGPDNENGYFCFEVSHGDYRLSAIATKLDATLDLLFSP
ncbi:hypothetical protein Tco_1136794 [Tanacetum coccineum]